MRYLYMASQTAQHIVRRKHRKPQELIRVQPGHLPEVGLLVMGLPRGLGRPIEAISQLIQKPP